MIFFSVSKTKSIIQKLISRKKIRCMLLVKSQIPFYVAVSDLSESLVLDSLMAY